MFITTAILNGLKIERLFHIFLMSQNSMGKNVHVLKILQTRLQYLGGREVSQIKSLNELERARFYSE